MAKTPTIMMAAQGLLNNESIAFPASISAAMTAYATPAAAYLSDWTTVYSLMQGHLYDDPLNLQGITPSTVALFLGQQYLHGVYHNQGFTDAITSHINNLLAKSGATTDNGKFALYLQVVSGFVDKANSYINSARNGAVLCSNTFTSMDALMTGNISAVNKFTNAWGQDLLATGRLYDFSRLDIFGTPQALANTLVKNNLLVSVADHLDAQGIDVFDLQSAINENAGKVMKPDAQKRCYTAFEGVVGTQLQDILDVLGVTTAGLTSLTDLLNPVKMFPNSFETLTSLNDGTLEYIYTDAAGTIASYVSAFDTEFAAVMPVDVAKANYALALALRQIKKIDESTAAAIGNQAVSLETNQGLTELDNLTAPVPADVSTFYLNMFSGGSGPDGTYYMTDFFGSIVTTTHADNLAAITTDLATNVVTSAVPGVLQDMADLLTSGDYATPGYTSWDDAMLTMINDNLVPAMATVDTTASVAAYTNSLDLITFEETTLASAGIEFPSDLKADTQSILSFSENLHVIGQKSEKGGMAEILEKVASSTRGGQALVAAMREGRNIEKLTNAGLITDSGISDQPSITEPGDIQGSTY